MARCLEDNVDVRFGSLADMTAPISYVRYPPKSGHGSESVWMSVKCQKQTPPTTRSPGLHARATRPAPWQSVDAKKVPNLVSRHPYRP